MKFQRGSILGKIIIGMLLFVLILAVVAGCAPLTEEYWQDKYESMTEQELADARANGATVADIWIGAQTSSILVCIDGECSIVQIY